MHRHYHFCFWGDECFNFLGINVRMLLHAIGKNNSSTLSHKGQSSRHKGVARNNNLVARLYVAQYCRHFERIGTRSSEQALFESITLLEKILTTLGENTIARKLSAIYRFVYIMRLFTCEVGFVEWNHIF